MLKLMSLLVFSKSIPIPIDDVKYNEKNDENPNECIVNVSHQNLQSDFVRVWVDSLGE